MSDDTDIAWPQWMLRYIMQDDEASYNALMWSVGGSPPYGGVSYEEGAAVYELIEDFRGAGRASPERYDAVRAFLADQPGRAQVLELFACYDEIVSDSEAYGREVAARGRTIAESLGESGLVGVFMLFEAGVAYRESNPALAAQLTTDALEPLLLAADRDPACASRAEAAAQNAVTFTALSGDVPRALALCDDLAEVIKPGEMGNLRRWLASRA